MTWLRFLGGIVCDAGRFLFAMPRSLIAFVLTGFLGLLSMGVLGALLYYPAAPILLLLYPAPGTWHGDWVWPVYLFVGMVASFGFLWAGIWHRLLSRRQWQTGKLAGGYLSILWGWNLFIWLALLGSFYRP